MIKAIKLKGIQVTSELFVSNSSQIKPCIQEVVYADDSKIKSFNNLKIISFKDKRFIALFSDITPNGIWIYLDKDYKRTTNLWTLLCFKRKEYHKIYIFFSLAFRQMVYKETESLNKIPVQITLSFKL
jgi:hypothetical protein